MRFFKRFFDDSGFMECLITKKDVYDMGRDNPIIANIVTAHEHGKLDWPSSLAIMVAELHKQNIYLNEKFATMIRDGSPLLTSFDFAEFEKTLRGQE